MIGHYDTGVEGNCDEGLVIGHYDTGDEGLVVGPNLMLVVREGVRLLILERYLHSLNDNTILVSKDNKFNSDLFQIFLSFRKKKYT